MSDQNAVNVQENATIQNTFLGIEDHGVLTFVLHVGGDGWGQGVGMMALDTHRDNTFLRPGFAYGLPMIRRILEVVGVDSWEKLPAQHIRVRRDKPCGEIIAIGNFVKEHWLNFKECIARCKEIDHD